MNNFNEQPMVSLEGHVLIKDVDSGEVLLQRQNAINFQNFAFVMANLLANKLDGDQGYFIHKMAFGYGGTVIDANGNISYKSPKIDGLNGGLYTPLTESGVNFEKVVSNMEIADAESKPYTDIVITTVLDYDEPAGQQSVDDAVNFDDPDNFVIDELALVTETGHYLTHLIFHPIQKSSNRKIEILYTIRVRAGV